MKITLPVSKREIEVPTLSYKQGTELTASQRKLRGTSVTAKNIHDVHKMIEQSEQNLDNYLSSQVEGFEDLPFRDIVLLRQITTEYTQGEPIAAIKNLLATGDGAPTSSEEAIVPTA